MGPANNKSENIGREREIRFDFRHFDDHRRE